MPLQSLCPGLSQRASPAYTKCTSSLCSVRLTAPNALPEGPARGGFHVGARLASSLENVDARRCIIAAAASAAAASSSSFFPSYGNKPSSPSPLARDRPLAGVLAAAAIQVGLALIKIARQIVLGMGFGQQQQQRAATALARRPSLPPSSSPLLPPRPTAPLCAALSMLSDSAFSLEQKFEKWGAFMLAARARAVSAASAAAAGAGSRGKRREKEEAGAATAARSARDRRVSVAAAAAALYDATTAAAADSGDAAMAATVVDAEAALYSKIYASILLSSSESEDKKKKKRR